MYRKLPAFVFLLALPANAQLADTNRVIGWVNPGSSGQGAIHVQDVDACTPARSLCTALPGTSSALAGGTAYDPRRQSVWISDGVTLTEVVPADCKTLCTMPAQRMDPQAVVSGLAITSYQRLIQLETRAGYVGLRSYDVRACPPVPLRDGCQLTVSSQATATGIAYDDVRDLLYIALTEPGPALPFVTLLVARLGDKCNPVCGLRQLGYPFHGLAYDAWTETLWATTGQVTIAIRADDPLQCKFTPGKSCIKQTPDPFAGLAVVPGWTRTDFGKGCVGKGCPFCSSIAARLFGGDPAIGNPDFGTRVENGPVPASGFLLLAAGRCTKGVGLPFLCGAIYPALSPQSLVLAAGPLSGKGQCLASVAVRMPIPINPSLCGKTLCLQWVVGCGAAAPTDLALTQAIQFTITGT